MGVKGFSDVTPAQAHNLQQSISFTSGTTYAFSIWMKAGTLTEGGISTPSAALALFFINRVNLTTGAAIGTFHKLNCRHR
jgi:hypothetical protein